MSGLIELVMQERKLLELGLDEGRPRDVWRRLRFVADQARQFTDSYGGDLRRYLAWVELQQRDDVRAVEVVLPESDDDAVRVLTVHGAKGLEFPIVFLTGLSRPGSFESGPQVLWGPDGPEVRLTKRVKTGGFDELATREAAMNQAQDLRLLYVAATRARDHLVVSLHHQASAKSCHAAVLGPLCAAEPDLCRYLDDGTGAPAASRTGNAAAGSTGRQGLGRAGPGDPDRTRSQSDVVGTTAPILPEDEQAPRRAWDEQRAQLVGPGVAPEPWRPRPSPLWPERRPTPPSTVNPILVWERTAPIPVWVRTVNPILVWTRTAPTSTFRLGGGVVPVRLSDEPFTVCSRRSISIPARSSMTSFVYKRRPRVSPAGRGT